MKNAFPIILIVLICAAILAYAVSRKPHEFTPGECVLCHVSTEPGADDITMEITVACEMCHPEYPKIQSHPTDIYPTISLPDDFPLTDGRLTCITCHFSHVEKLKHQDNTNYFLRRPIRGIIFCSACHKIDEKRHIVFENIHKGQYEELDRKIRIDRMSLECIQCHDKYMGDPVKSLGAGTWMHYKKEFNHIIGASYKDVSMKKMNEFRPMHMLDEKLKLYDGKMGCGTCHNIYSKEKSMLAVSNADSRLCFECHIK